MSRHQTFLVTDTTPYRVEIVDKKDQKCRKAMSDTGTGSFALQRSSSNYATLNADQVIVHTVDGVEFFSQLIESIDQTTVGAGEEADQKSTFSGRGVLAEWARAIVYPKVGQKPFGDVRYFDFSSPELGETGWSAAIFRFWQCDDVDDVPYGPPLGLFGAPQTWPDPAGYWIAPNALVGDRDPENGIWYARKHFTLDVEYQMVIYVAADDLFDFRLDGQPIASFTDETSGDGWETGQYVRIAVSPGEHVFAVKVTNTDRTKFARGNTGNISVFLMAAYKIVQTADGPIQQLVCRSDTSWLTLSYPAQAPGFTALQIIDILLQEAIGRGVLTGWQTLWSGGGTHDIHGIVCPITGDVNFRYGTNYLDVLKQLGDGWIEYEGFIAPTSHSRVFNAYVARGISTSPGMGEDASVTISPGVNATAMQHVRDVSKLDTVMLTRYDGGYFDLPTTGPNPYGRREGFLSLNDTKDLVAAKNVTTQSLSDTTSIDSMTAEQWAAVGGLTPPIAYDIGSRVNSVDRTLTPQQVRVVAISVQEPITGALHVVPELQNPVQSLGRTTEQWLSRTANGTLDGRSSVATPGPVQTIESGPIPQNHFDWAQPGDSVEDIGTPQTEVKPVKFVRFELRCDHFMPDTPPTASHWALTRNGHPVATCILPANKVYVSVCLPDDDPGLTGIANTQWNATVTSSGHHSSTTFVCHYVITN